MLESSIGEESDDSHALPQMVAQIRLQRTTNPFMGQANISDIHISAVINSAVNYSNSQQLNSRTPKKQPYSVTVCRASETPKNLLSISFLKEMALKNLPEAIQLENNQKPRKAQIAQDKGKSPSANYMPGARKGSKGLLSLNESRDSRLSKSHTRSKSKKSIKSQNMGSSMQLFQQYVKDL